MTPCPGTAKRVVVVAQQAVVRWRRSMTKGSFDRILADIEHDRGPSAPDCVDERHAFRQGAVLPQDRTGTRLTDADPLPALVRQALGAEPSQS